MRQIFRPAAVVLTSACLALAISAISSGEVLAQAKQAPPKQAAPAAPPPAAEAPAVKQIALTEKQIQGVLAASKDVDAITDKIPDNAKPDPKVDAQLDAVAKKNGFASLAEHDDVSMNIAIIMSGIDQETKKFTEVPERIREEIAALKADKSVSDAAKKEDLAQLEVALRGAKPIQFKENIALVLKHFDELLPLMQVQGPAD